jgi:hypothetical protein
MNIHNFPNFLSLAWEEIDGEIGKIPMRFLLPYTDEKNVPFPDLRGSRIVDFCLSRDRVVTDHLYPFVWIGGIECKQKENTHHYPIFLEIMPLHEGEFKYAAFTPPGRLGNPATILIDSAGFIVPEVSWNLNSEIRIFFLRHDLKGFGWELIYPAIGLQFVTGVYESTPKKTVLWSRRLFDHR